MTILLLLLALVPQVEARPHREGHHDRPRDHVQSHVVDRRHGNDVMVVTHWIGPFRFTFVHDVPDRDRPRPSHRGNRRHRGC